MALSGSQQQMANLIYGIGRSRGLSDARARELVAAAYAESGLNPSIRNTKSGATGLFQLLSSGYVNRANALGGVTNPRANINAILPNYLSYWRSNPNAPAGAAAAAVEASGKGPGFYSAPLGLIGGLSSAGTSSAPLNTVPGHASGGLTVSQPQSAPENPHAYSTFALNMINSFKTKDANAMLGAIMALRNATKPQPVSQPVQPRQPNSSPVVPQGKFITSTSYTGGGNDIQMMEAAQSMARKMGLHMSENYDLPGGVNPVHVKDSYHYQRYANDRGLGRAMDVTGTPQQMSAYYKYMSRTNPTELFYDPLGGMKYGKNIGPIGGHQTHVHIAY